MKTRLVSLLLGAATLAAQAGVPDAGYVAHEWGTFTSVQGADGVQLEWNPLTLWELPGFVYELNRVRSKKHPAAFLAKTAMQSRQRMETPVIYFYTDTPRTVDAAVLFPQGTITEWYPQETAADLTIRSAAVAATRPALNWKGLQLVPANSAAGTQLATQMPQDKLGRHYFAARETDAALVRIAKADQQSEVEKFLFYRGLGNFQAPLTAKLEGELSDSLQLRNTGAEPLSALFVLEVRGNEGRMFAAGDLAPGASRTVPLLRREGFNPLDQVQASLGDRMCKALVAAGLYEREAAAMVKTWEAAWFAEPGTRALYLLPRAWTDRTLPLQLSPAPREIARVMVGRAELITPQMEQALLSNVERYLAAPEGERAAIVEATRSLGYGRFTEAVLRRLMAMAPRSKAFSAQSWELLAAASLPQHPVLIAPR